LNRSSEEKGSVDMNGVFDQELDSPSDLDPHSAKTGKSSKKAKKKKRAKRHRREDTDEDDHEGRTDDEEYSVKAGKSSKKAKKKRAKNDEDEGGDSPSKFIVDDSSLPSYIADNPEFIPIEAEQFSYAPILSPHFRFPSAPDGDDDLAPRYQPPPATTTP